MNKTETFQLLSICLIYLIAFVAVCGNFTILAAFAKFKNIRQKRTFLLLVQAFADLWMSAGIIISYSLGRLPMLFIGEEFYNTLTKRYCILSMLPFTIGMLFGQLNLLSLAIERCYATIRPLKYSTLPKARPLKISLCLNAPFTLIHAVMLFVSIHDLDAIPADCGVGNNVTMGAAKYFYVMMFTIGVSLLSLYGASLLLLSRKMKHAHSLGDAVMAQLTKEIKIQKTIKIIMLVYGVGWLLPMMGYAILESFDVSKWAIVFLVPLGAEMNAAANFFVYLWRHKELKAAFKKLFTREAPAQNPVNVIEL